MRFELVASDYDDSLCPKGYKVSDYTRKVIKKFTNKGGHFVIITGRMNYSIYPIAKELGLDGEIVACQGADIRDMRTNKVIRNKKIPHDLAVEYLRFAESLHLIPQIYADNKLYTINENEAIKNYSNFCKVDFEYIDGLLSDFLDNNLGDIDMMYLWTSEKDQKKNIKLISEKFKGRLDITSSTAHNIEAVVKGASKSEALEFLANKYNIPISKTMAFGDSLNDRSMIMAAGLGVAMQNAKDGLKEDADYVCEASLDDGVAKTIEKFCL